MIEAKPTPDQIDKAYDEASEYGSLINKHRFIKAKIVSGVAGNDFDRYLVKTGYWEEDKKNYTPITYNEKEITSLLSPTLAKILLEQDSPHLKDLEIDETEYIKIAEEINQVLHEASVKKDVRAGIVASVLLSLLGETEPNYNDVPSIFINDINSRAYNILKKDKKEFFADFIRVPSYEKEDAQNKFKEALVSSFFLLKKVNIKSAMRAGSDILGKFYEGFLKYGNGAKDLGILLTPRHITEFAADVLNISHKDIIYDPTCGTGGFLVSAFYYVKKNSTPDQLENFKKYRIFGVDKQPTITALAIVNMLFRGDGKNNIINYNCFARALAPATVKGESSAEFVSKEEGLKITKHPVTKVLMNPPFALKKEKEFEFIDHALQQMEDGGLLFSLAPISVMIERGKARKWREKLLTYNTLLSVVTFPIGLFYQASGSQQTVGIFIKKGIPHDKSQKVLWGRVVEDGYVKKKRKRLYDPNAPDDLSKKIRPLAKAFVNNPDMEIEEKPKLQIAKIIDPDDKLVELVPEAYLTSEEMPLETIREKIQSQLRGILSFLIFDGAFSVEQLPANIKLEPWKAKTITWTDKSLSELFNFRNGYSASLFDLKESKEKDTIALFRPTSTIHNIIAGWIDKKELAKRKTFPAQSLLTSTDGEGSHTYSYITPLPFVPNSNTSVLVPKETMPLSFLLYAAVAITNERWRYSYGRKPKGIRFKRLKIKVPINADNTVDYNAFEDVVKTIPEYQFLKSFWQMDIHH